MAQQTPIAGRVAQLDSAVTLLCAAGEGWTRDELNGSPRQWRSWRTTHNVGDYHSDVEELIGGLKAEQACYIHVGDALSSVMMLREREELAGHESVLPIPAR
jgi:hypothetical protein